MRKVLVGLCAVFAVLGVAQTAAALHPENRDATVGSSQSGTEVSVHPAATPSDPDDVVAPDGAVLGPVDVLQVDGLFDDIIVAEINDAIDRGEEANSQALILQVNTRGAVVGDDAMAALLRRIADVDVAVAVWVGPAGSQLTGTPAQLLAVADVSGMSPGARVGKVGDPVDPSIPLGEALESLHSRTVGLAEARELGVFKQRISDEGIATLPNMIDALDGYESNGTVLDTTSELVADDGTVQRETIAVTRFFKLSLVDQLFHTVASPEVAYLLLLVGLALIVFEFYTAGIGIASVVGASCLVLAATGLAELPTRWWAAALIAAAMLAFAVDVQVGIPRFWTGIGLVLTTIGSFTLFAPVEGTSLRPSWISLIAGIGGIALAFIVGMPSMTRTRFATPTIGREWMIGSLGQAVVAVDPDGIVTVDDAQWRARTNRATPLAAGEALRVVAIDGVTLEVEPLEGAARDYREMRGRSESTDADPASQSETVAADAAESDTS